MPHRGNNRYRPPSRQWNKKLDAALKGLGLKRNKYRACVYFREDSSLIVAFVQLAQWLER